MSANKIEQTKLEIILTKSVTFCIDEFLDSFEEIIREHSAYSRQESKLDYILMKRFLYTAYNNLVEMDLSISRGKIVEPKKHLDVVEKSYKKLELLSLKPIQNVYETIFLSKQIDYVELKKEQENIKLTLNGYNIEIRTMKRQLEVMKEELLSLANDKSKYEDRFESYKRINRNYTDKIHDSGKLKEKLAMMGDIIVSFENLHSISFNQYFYEACKKVQVSMIEILDGISYEFDKILWTEAKSSNIIKKFFINAKIEGSYSSKTYLKYYVKNLDKEQMSQAQEKLHELLKYLENFSSKSIFILGKDIDEIGEKKVFIEQIDKDYQVLGSISPDKIYLERRKRDLDLIIIYNELRQFKPLDVVKEYYEMYPDSKNTTKILILYENPTYKELDLAGRSGIKYFMRIKDIDKNTFIEKIRSII